MGPLDIWMILAGWLGLLLPLPSLWWAWHRWANEARGRTSHDKTYRITLVSLRDSIIGCSLLDRCGALFLQAQDYAFRRL